MSKKFNIEVSEGFTGKIRVLVNNEPIGLIQEINFKASANNPFAEIEVIFPDFTDTSEWAYSQELANKVKDNVEKLKEFSHVKIAYKKL